MCGYVGRIRARGSSRRAPESHFSHGHGAAPGGTLALARQYNGLGIPRVCGKKEQASMEALMLPFAVAIKKTIGYTYVNY